MSLFKLHFRLLILLLAVISKVHSLKLECRFKENNWNEKECIFEKIEIETNMLREPVEISTINSSVTPNVEYDRVFVDFTCYFRFIPKEIFIEMPRLTSFIANFIDLKKLYPDTFENAKQLKFLELAENNIKSLKVEIFRHLENLEQINLFGNPITHIDLDLFSNLILNLRFADLRGGSCANEFFVIESNNYKYMKFKLMKCFGSNLTIYDVIGENSTDLIQKEDTEEIGITSMFLQKFEETQAFIAGNRIILASCILLVIILILGFAVMIAICNKL